MARKFRPKKPIENHDTAAWAQAGTRDRRTNIAHPDIADTIDAKEYVDENEK